MMDYWCYSRFESAQNKIYLGTEETGIGQILKNVLCNVVCFIAVIDLPKTLTKHKVLNIERLLGLIK